MSFRDPSASFANSRNVFSEALMLLGKASRHSLLGQPCPLALPVGLDALQIFARCAVPTVALVNNGAHVLDLAYGVSSHFRAAVVRGRPHPYGAVANRTAPSIRFNTMDILGLRWACGRIGGSSR